MKLVGAGLCHQVNDRAAAAAVLRGVIIRLHLKFLNRIDGGKLRDAAGFVIVVVDAVDHEIVRGRALPVRGITGDAAFAALLSAAAARCGNAGIEQRQLREIAAVERKSGDLRFVDDAAEMRCFCVGQRDVALDGDRLRGTAPPPAPRPRWRFIGTSTSMRATLATANPAFLGRRARKSPREARGSGTRRYLAWSRCGPVPCRCW